MKFKLTHKLLIAFALTVLLSIGLMVLIMNYFLSGSLIDYVSELELKRRQNVVQKLEKFFRENQGWEIMEAYPSEWNRLLSSTRGFRREGEMPPPMKPFHDSGGMMEMRGPRGPRGPGMQHGMGFNRRLALLDKKKQWIAGNRSINSSSSLHEIVVGDNTVGWLAFRELENLSDPMDLSLHKKQQGATYWAGAVSLFFAVFLAALFSRHLISPIRRLAKGTKDITNRKFGVEIEITSSDELGELARDFNQMSTTLEKYENQRKQWISDISHDLGTPLSILRGEIEAMQDGIRPLSVEKLSSLHQEVMFMSKLVQDLRDLSLADTGGLSYSMKEIDLNAIMKECLSLFYRPFEEKKIKIIEQFEETEQRFIQGDQDRLKQLFSNIFENALRHSNTPGSLTIGIQQKAELVLIGIEDSGPGVPEESIPHLFDRLYRVDLSRSRQKGGSGLGLAICKVITEAHGGTIRAVNAKGGLRMEIFLPINLTTEGI